MNIIIFLATLVVAKAMLWSSLNKYTPGKGYTWKSLLNKDLPRLLAGSAKVALVLIGALALAGVVGSMVSHLPNESIIKLGVVLGLMLICALGADNLLKERVRFQERVLLWGFFGLAVVLLVQSKIPGGILPPEQFLLGVGVYIIALSVFWVLSYWPSAQNALAIPVGMVIAVALLGYQHYLNSGELLFTSWEPAKSWPAVMVVASIFVLSLVFWQRKDWRRRWSYRALVLFFTIFLVKGAVLVGLLLTNTISSARIAEVVRYNRAVALYTEAMASAVGQDGGEEEVLAKMAETKKGLAKRTANPQQSLRLLGASMRRLQTVENLRAEVYQNRPQNIALEDILWGKIRVGWHEYATPLINRTLANYRQR